MALNFQQVFEKIREISTGARQRQERLETLHGKAVGLLEGWAGKNKDLQEKVERAVKSDPNLRCALPLDEPLDYHEHCEDLPTDPVTLIAADGSQIIPDRHEAINFGLINVGAIIQTDQPGEALIEVVDSQLSFENDVENWNEALVALMRDLAERKQLLALSKDYRPPLVTLTDGPLQLWESRESNEILGFKEALHEYLSILSQLGERQVITAGYVDKPSSNLVIRLLEVAETFENDLQDIHHRHPLQGVSDLWLFDNLLDPGERSAVFALRAKSEVSYTGMLALHFFYMNIGKEGHPKSVRVEIPAWVSSDKDQVDLLQCVLREQCAVMGAAPYPYILQRAHEVARVTPQEQQQIKQLLEIENRKAGGENGYASGKSIGKESLNAKKKRI